MGKSFPCVSQVDVLIPTQLDVGNLTTYRTLQAQSEHTQNI